MRRWQAEHRARAWKLRAAATEPFALATCVAMMLAACASRPASQDDARGPASRRPAVIAVADVEAAIAADAPRDVAAALAAPSPRLGGAIDAPRETDVVVIDESGAPITAAVISWQRPPVVEVEHRGPEVREVRPGAGDDRWIVSVQAPGYIPAVRSVARREAGRACVVMLSPGWTIGGRVTDAGGAPVPGAQVYLAEKEWSLNGRRFDALWSRAPLAVTDASGAYLIDYDVVRGYRRNEEDEGDRSRIAVGVVVSGFAPAISLDLVPSADARHHQADVVLERGVRVSGTVVAEVGGHPVGRARVAVVDCPFGHPWPPEMICARVFEYTTLTTEDGRFELVGPPPPFAASARTEVLGGATFVGREGLGTDVRIGVAGRRQ